MKKLFYLILVLLVLTLMLAAISHFSNRDKNITQVVLKGRTFQIEIADEPTKWQQGLSFKTHLADDEGMLFIYPEKNQPEFWMKDMNFAIDLLWIDNQTIVGWEKDMQVSDSDQSAGLIKYQAPQSIDKALEIPAGSIKQLGIEIGDQVEFN